MSTESDDGHRPDDAAPDLEQQTLRPGRHRDGKRTISPVLPGLLIVILLLGGVLLVTPGDNLETLRRLTRFGGADGPYEFVNTQPGSETPVGYNPCQAINVAVNPDGAPGNWENLVDTAIRHTNDATGLRFQRVANTRERDFSRKYDGSGPRPPVLVAWATTAEVPDLEGDVIGLSASRPIVVDGRLEYVTGVVVLDSIDFADYDLSRDQPYAQAVLDHEFGHLVGLDHVHDKHELMNEDNLGLTSYGPGDLEGLERLGEIDC